MGRKKGQSPKAFEEGKLDKYNLKERSLEERKRISRMGVEARRKNKEEKLQLQKCMKTLLEMKTNSDKSKQVLRSFGFDNDEDLTNKTLLMVALFRKGLTGDVQATREIINMMDKLDLYNESGKVTNNVVINLMPTGEVYQPNEEDEKEIWDAENDDSWMDEDDEEWGEEIYNG